jgi:hypothetical protein
MTHDGIDKAREPKAVAKVRGHFAAFRQCPSHNGHGRGGKGILKEPKGQINLVLIATRRQEEIGRADKGQVIRVAVRVTVRKGVAKHVKGHSSPTRIEQVFNHLQQAT